MADVGVVGVVLFVSVDAVVVVVVIVVVVVVGVAVGVLGLMIYRCCRRKRVKLHVSRVSAIQP